MPDLAAPYVTVQGDMYDLIAFRLWRDETLMNRLIELNPEHQDTVVFSAGIELNVPVLTPPIRKGPVPPWQQ